MAITAKTLYYPIVGAAGGVVSRGVTLHHMYIATLGEVEIRVTLRGSSFQIISVVMPTVAAPGLIS